MIILTGLNYIRAQLEDQFDAQTIYRSGFSVYTTIDPELQEKAETIVKEQVSALADRNATNGALVAIKPSTGRSWPWLDRQILIMRIFQAR